MSESMYELNGVQKKYVLLHFMRMPSLKWIELNLENEYESDWLKQL